MTDPAVAELIARSHRLGADPRNTNYGGGNASVKASGTDPVTGELVDLLWVKGSGGDLGTLAEPGLAVLRLDRLRALAGQYAGPGHEDEMAAALDYCLYGRGGAAPSIDTAMHALTGAAHVDHLHPDAGIALATAADGEELTRRAFGGRVGWLPWRRPGFQLGLEVAAVQRDNPGAIGVILGGHGITAWGETSLECERRSLEIIATAAVFLREHGRPDPLGPVRPAWAALPRAQRHARAAELAPLLRGLVSAGGPQVGHFDDSELILDFLARSRHPELAAAGTSCPDHFLRTKIAPMVLDLAADALVPAVTARLRELHAAYRARYQAYYLRHAGPSSPPMRGADPAIVLVPGTGMFSFGRDKQAARLAADFYRSAVSAIRGAEAVSRYAPISEAERFKIEYWELEEAKLRRMPPPRRLAGRVALVTGAGSGIGKAIAARLAAEGACVVAADRNDAAARATADGIGSQDEAVPVTADVRSAAQVSDAFAAAALAFGGVDIVINNAGLSVSRPLAETTERDWDRQHDVLAKGSFLVSRQAAAMLRAQQLGGDIIYICSKNAVAAGPDNIAYAAAKADQAHQVRLLAAELGGDGIRVNGINPDGVVRGSGIFAGGWGAERARVHGVPASELGAFYAQRTLLRREVLPEHVAAAVVALTAGDLPLTTGAFLPVDGGVPAAFPR